MGRPIASVLTVLALSAAGLSACQKGIEAPTTTGVCYQVVLRKDGTARFNEVARDQDSLEACAAQLEAVRMRFIRLGSPRREIIGAYQGRFLFLDAGGASVSTTGRIDGGRFVALARAADGRLMVPSYIPQPEDQPAAAPATRAPARP